MTTFITVCPYNGNIFFKVTFVNDDHVDSLSQTCVHLECLGISFCEKFNGSSLKALIQRCKRLKTLLMEQTGKTGNLQ